MKQKIGIIISSQSENKFVIRIGYNTEKKKKEIFFTAPAIKEMFEKKQLPFGSIGSCSAAVYPSEKEIAWTGFYPFEYCPWLQRKGIASKIDALIAKSLMNRFPDYNIRSGLRLEQGRLNQYKNWKIPVRKPVQIKEYHKRQARYLKRAFKEHNKPK